MVIIVLAAVAGFLTNELGPEKRINILAFPLLGIIAWNLSVYAVGFVLLLRRRNQQFESGLIHSLVSLITRPVREKKESPHDLASGEKISADARIAFENQWTKFLFPLWSAKLKSFLHIAALVLAGGAIAGMYYKGLSKEYLVVWDSTFIKDGATLRPFLNMVLGPASSIFGDPLPSAAELDQLHRDPVGENAAKWIHWYAVTIAIYVLIPRAFLAGVWHFKAARTARNVPFRSASPRYFERLLSRRHDPADACATLVLRRESARDQVCQPDSETRELVYQSNRGFAFRDQQIQLSRVIARHRRDKEPHLHQLEYYESLPDCTTMRHPDTDPILDAESSQ